MLYARRGRATIKTHSSKLGSQAHRIQNFPMDSMVVGKEVKYIDFFAEKKNAYSCPSFKYK